LLQYPFSSRFPVPDVPRRVFYYLCTTNRKNTTIGRPRTVAEACRVRSKRDLAEELFPRRDQILADEVDRRAGHAQLPADVGGSGPNRRAERETDKQHPQLVTVQVPMRDWVHGLLACARRSGRM
jgi:hypothetical protein